MPRDGSGNYVRAVAAYVGGDVAEADGAAGVNTEMDDFADGLTDSVARNGEAPWTGDQDADGFSVTGLRASVANGEAVRHQQLTALSTVYEAKDATLTAIAGTTFASGQILRATGPDTFTVDNSTTYGRSLWNVANEAALKALINAEADVDFQNFDGDLASIAALSTTVAGRSILTYVDPNADCLSFWDDSAGAFAGATMVGASISGTVFSVNFATATDIRANSAAANTAVDVVKAWQSVVTVALTDAATIAVDMNAGINFTVTLGGNRTLGSPTNEKTGQSGFIKITQDGTGSRTLAYGSEWLFAGGVDPTLSTAAGAVDILFYTVLAPSQIVASLVKAVA